MSYLDDRLMMSKQRLMKNESALTIINFQDDVWDMKRLVKLILDYNKFIWWEMSLKSIIESERKLFGMKKKTFEKPSSDYEECEGAGVCHRNLILFWVVGMPCQAFFVKLDYNLWTSCIGLLRWHEVSFVSVFPFHQEHEIAACISCSNDAFSHESSVKSFFAVRFLFGGWFCFNRIGGFALLSVVCSSWNYEQTF